MVEVTPTTPTCESFILRAVTKDDQSNQSGEGNQARAHRRGHSGGKGGGFVRRCHRLCWGVAALVKGTPNRRAPSRTGDFSRCNVPICRSFLARPRGARNS